MPRRLADHTGDTYHCTVESLTTGCIIHLQNERTDDEWTCAVTHANVNALWTGSGTPLSGFPFTAVGVLQDVIYATSYSGAHCYGSVSLINKYSPYYMELKVRHKLFSTPVEWSFPMVPKDVSKLEKRTAALALRPKMSE
ncbi:uncharacterized protein IUM83_08987 [Phytophthora cinnamomi]|uniref:uncharacterized protein n=1 Tax=Phytophthora cinnamomi TaxID=4785 RepID=UPI0035596743|nr:hypothetical protein IUM83_08987 [Phytophthora cinnamomi]